MGCFISSATSRSEHFRIALCIEYQGKNFKGWQSQRSSSVPTVQETLESALSQVADHPVQVYCAGRTDSGVHASSQIVHFETSSERPLNAWVRGANALLPGSVAVRWAKQVSSDFHARFSARSRRYCYVIYNNRVPTALLDGMVTQHFYSLDEELMHEAAQHLLGELDFSSFRGAGCQSNTAMRNISSISVRRSGDFVFLDIKANAFLLHMVRNIVGALLEVGEARQKPEWIKEVLLKKDRRLAGVTAKPDGLYLVEVEYPEQFEIPISSWVFPFLESS